MSIKENEYELTEPLINQQHCQERNNDSQPLSAIVLQLISQLFDDEFRRDRVSNQILLKIGGYKTLQEQLKTNLRQGIHGTQSDINQRINNYGHNQPIVRSSKTFLKLFQENLKDPLLKIICLTTAVSIVLRLIIYGFDQGWQQGFSILLGLLILAIVASGGSYVRLRLFRQLNDVKIFQRAKVLRNGQVILMNISQILVGDIIQIQVGERLPVDGVVIESRGLKLDQSEITGEFEAVKKGSFEQDNNNDCFLVSGSRVEEGSGRMLVLAVGDKTVQNKMKRDVQQIDQQTPLEQKLLVFADTIGSICVYGAGIVFAVLALLLFITCLYNDQPIFSLLFTQKLVESLLTVLCLIFLANLEDLKFAVYISLAQAVTQLKKQNVLVRSLSACETMGSVSHICIDKTGLLTKNHWIVTKLWALGSVIDKFDKNQEKIALSFKELLAYGLAVSSDAQPSIQSDGKSIQKGNRIECALLEMAYKLGYNYRKLRQQAKEARLLSLNSQRKGTSVIFMNPLTQKYYIFSKGDPESLIKNCKYYLNRSSEYAEIDEDWRRAFELTMAKFSEQGLQSILICFKEISKEETQHPELFQQGLVVFGVAGIKDSIKESIPQTVYRFSKAGIQLLMVTGESAHTATVIAKDAQIIKAEFIRTEHIGKQGYYTVMEGDEFRQLIQKKQNVSASNDRASTLKIVKELKVLAKAYSQDKYMLVKRFQQLQNMVAVTGDGAGDAPALKKANVGIAMGIASTQFTKQAAGIILGDDNLSSLLLVVQFGRNIIENVRKVIQFSLTAISVTIIMVILGAITLKQSPLNAIQLIYLSLIVSKMVMGLASQPASSQLLMRQTFKPKQHLISAEMKKTILFNIFYQCTVMGLILFKGPALFGASDFTDAPITDFKHWNSQNEVHLSLFFNVFVFLQIFNVLNCRTLLNNKINVFSGLFRNHKLLLMIVWVVLLQLLVIEYSGQFLHLVPLSLTQHVQCMLIGGSCLFWTVIVKLVIPQSFLNRL